MATDLQTGPETSLSELVTGIVKDVQELLAQQLKLFKEELSADFRKSKEAAVSLAFGGGALLLAVGLLCLMLVYLLHEVATLPLWACFGIVGGVLAVLGGALVFAGKHQLDTVTPFPQESAQALKENVQCLINPK
jgi:hypothetical protein